MLRSLERGHDWAIVLAGGSGTRLSALARDRNDRPIPSRTARCAAAVRCSPAPSTVPRPVPREHIVVVVAAEHAEFGAWNWRICRRAT